MPEDAVSPSQVSYVVTRRGTLLLAGATGVALGEILGRPGAGVAKKKSKHKKCNKRCKKAKKQCDKACNILETDVNVCKNECQIAKKQCKKAC